MTLSLSLPTTSAQPLHATPRTSSRTSDGAQVAVIADTLGTPLIPWQRLVADVATERRGDGSYEYQVVIVSVPRQTGKTTLIRAIGTHSALVLGRDVFYTAQTGKDARERWLDLVKILRVHPALAGRVSIGLRGGSEQIGFHHGGAFRVFAPTPESLHGYTPPKVFIDEAFAQTGPAGDLLMGAIGPAQITVTDRQLWIVSTAGTAESTFLHDWIDRGIEGTPRVACFVWAARDDQDPYNPDDVAAFHPGVGHRLNGQTLTAGDVIAQADRLSPAEYERAFANRRTATTSNLIPAEAWRALTVPDLPAPDPRTVTLTYDVAHDRTAAAIVATWPTSTGVAGKIVRGGPGMGWVPAAVVELRTSMRPAAIAAADNGPTLEVTQVLTAGRVPVRTLTEREFATATGGLLARIDEHTLEHDGDPVLAASVAGLVTRPAVSDGVAFSRRHSVGDSSPAVALAVGAWVTSYPRHKPAPVATFGTDTP